MNNAIEITIITQREVTNRSKLNVLKNFKDIDLRWLGLCYKKVCLTIYQNIVIMIMG